MAPPELLYFGMRVTMRSNVSDLSWYMKQREHFSLSYGMKQRTSTPFLKTFKNWRPLGVGGGGSILEALNLKILRSGFR